MVHILHRLAPLILLGAAPIYAQDGEDTQKPQILQDMIPRDIERALIENTNATSGPQGVLGYNTAIPFPGEPGKDWTIALSVTGDAPWNRTSHITSSRISYIPPVMNRTIDSSWALQGTFFYLKTKLDGDAAVDTTCKGLLSDECRDSLSELLDGGVPPLDDFPSSCKEELRDVETRGLSATLGNLKDHFAITKTHAPGDKTVYDAAISEVFVTMIGFQDFADVRVGNDTENGVQGILACLRADKPMKAKAGDDTKDDAKKDGKDDAKKDGSGDTGAALALRPSAGFMAALLATVFAVGLI